MIKYIYYSACLVSALLISESHGDFPWVLLSEGERGRPDIYYNTLSIKKIDHDIMEVYKSVVYTEGRSVRQLRIDCDTGKLALGRIDIISNVSDTPDQTVYHNKRGWKWFSPRDTLTRKLIDIVCSKR